MSHTFISMAVTTMSSLYRDMKDKKIIGIIVENKQIKPWNRNKFRVCTVIRTFNHSLGV